MFDKKYVLLLLAFFSTMMLTIACSSETNGNDNNTDIPGGNSGNSGNSGSGGGSDGNGSGGNGSGGGGKPEIEEPLLPKTPIELNCNGEFYNNEEFTLNVTTSDNRPLEKLNWYNYSADNQVQVTPTENGASILVSKDGNVHVSVNEEKTGYYAECNLNIKNLLPKIHIDQNYYNFTVGETKNITYSIIPGKKIQSVEIEKPAVEGYDFVLKNNEISVTAKVEKATTELVLISTTNKEIKSETIYLSASNDFVFNTKVVGETKKENNDPINFTVNVFKNSPYTSYKLLEVPEWIKYSKNVVSEKHDEYIFTISKNERIRNRVHEIVFLPGNTENINDRKAKKVKVEQGRTYEPKNPRIVYFKGASNNNQEMHEGLNNDKKHYTTPRISNFYMYENGNKGWYNANKIVGNEATGKEDSNMCWMYTATNVIHWWLEHNKEEVKKYMDFKNPKVNDADKYSQGYYNYEYIPSNNLNLANFSDKINEEERRNKSDVAKLFRKVYPENFGGWPDGAVKWYLAGEDYYDNQHGTKPGFGLVKDIFPNGKTTDLIIKIPLDGMNQDRFNDIVKNAAKNDKLLSTSIQLSRTLHAINIWAYVEDAYGDVCELYVGDNNLPSFSRDNGNDESLKNEPLYQNPSNSYLLKKGIDIRNGDVILVDLQGGIKGLGPKMNVFYELDLSKKYFQEYFKKNGIN